MNIRKRVAEDDVYIINPNPVLPLDKLVLPEWVKERPQRTPDAAPPSNIGPSNIGPCVFNVEGLKKLKFPD